MNHTDVMAATRALEEALRDQEKARTIWLIARVAHPAVLDVTATERYAEASNAVADAQDAYDHAVIESQAEYLRGTFGEQTA